MNGRRLFVQAVLTTLATLPFTAVAALAEEQATPRPREGKPLWEAGLVSAALTTPSYPASDQPNSRVLVAPYMVYRGKTFRSDGGGLGARMVRNDALELDLGFFASLPASSKNIALRQDMPDLGFLLEFGPRATFKLAQPAPGQRVTLEVPLRAVLAFDGGVRHIGFALEPKLALEHAVAQDWRIKTSVALVFGDQPLNQYFYGVPQAYATATRPAFNAQGGLIGTRLGLDGGKRVGEDLYFYAFTRFDLHAGAANQDSPLFAQKQGNSLGLGMIWTMARSGQRAPD
ncbi:MAG: MipA/OmpV family protein [Rhodoferax sp.]|nr:MipA/OmpV family protein [Rhodoferax sp.]